MKTKDILIVAIAIVIIGGSVLLVFKMLGPSATNNTGTNNTGTQITDPKITGEIDEETLKAITEKKDYGEATLDNIGRTNPFGPLN